MGVQFLDTVIDMPVVVHVAVRKLFGLDVPVTTQRHVPAVLLR